MTIGNKSQNGEQDERRMDVSREITKNKKLKEKKDEKMREENKERKRCKCHKNKK